MNYELPYHAGNRLKLKWKPNFTVSLVIGCLLLGSTWVGRAADATPPPRITTQPWSRTNAIGTTAAFAVTATSSETPTYLWQFNGADLPGETKGTLTLSNVSQSHAGSYRVRVTNRSGSVLSSNGVLSVVPLLATTQPKSQKATCGATVRFDFGVEGAPPLSYQWYFMDTVPLKGASGSSLTLAGLPPNAEGKYYAIVTNHYGAITSAVVTLTLAPSNTIAVESFSYPAGPLKGQSGGIGMSDSYGTLLTDTVASGSLSYVDATGARLVATSNRFQGTLSAFVPRRNLNTNGLPPGLLDSTGRFGADGCTIYVRVLIRLESGSPTQGAAGLGLDDEIDTRLFIGDYGAIEGARDKYGIYDVQRRRDYRSTVPVDNQAHLLVARIDFAAGPETVRLYVDPPLAAEPATPSVPAFTVPDFRFTRFSLMELSSGIYSLDEICFATSWEAAAAIAPAARPIIVAGSLTRAKGMTSFLLSSEPGRVLTVEAAASLGSMEWVPIGTVTNLSGTTTFTDAASSLGSRFYRLQQRSAESGVTSSVSAR